MALPITDAPKSPTRRQHALSIWQAGVAAVQPANCLPSALSARECAAFDRILVVGGGKAGTAMTLALEEILSALSAPSARPYVVDGLVNVPNETVAPTRFLRLHPARPMGTNQPTAEAQAGAEAILDLVARAGPNDLLICLMSGGGSALLPAPVPGVSLTDKQALTALLHRSGATIQEMNAVRKHLSRIKGGGLLRDFKGKRVISLIISDVIGDPLDVIASGPTAPDPTTFADAVRILRQFNLWDQATASIRRHLERGVAGLEPETLKQEIVRDGQPLVDNRVIAHNGRTLDAAEVKARELGYRVVNLGPCLGSDTQAVAEVLADVARGQPTGTCLLSGGETTVVLPKEHGRGGRNQEFILASLHTLREPGMERLTILSGGTDGEDGPTDAAGAIADVALVRDAQSRGIDPADYLARHDAYNFFAPLGGLLKTGLTHTNVMDLRVTLVS